MNFYYDQDCLRLFGTAAVYFIERLEALGILLRLEFVQRRVLLAAEALNDAEYIYVRNKTIDENLGNWRKVVGAAVADLWYCLEERTQLQG